ncbi:MAG TPA: crosslink repair DNA glycosylase YcaQ family protein [Pseudonocardiaceae bacterium]|nr:crosslink repair DNA glycosylase YcaQ family protein [Pseudonocardiaceae bacterium]
MERVTREQVLAYRIAAQELHRGDARPAELAVTELGVQDTPAGTARLAISARTTADVADDRLAMVWSTRGAPHLHRRADLASLAAALWPLTDADARARIVTTRIREGAKLGIAAFRAAATAMFDVVTEPMAKGAVSGAVTARVPESLSFWCPVCESQHISGAVFQQVGVFAGVELVPGARTTTLAPIGGWVGPPDHASGTDRLIRTYLRLLGPATEADVAGFVGANRTELRRAWPADGLVEVDVAGRAAWLPEDDLDLLLDPPEPPGLRLVPAGDPFLQARDRQLVLPDPVRHKQVWKAISNPGVLLVDGDVGGTWRAKLAGKRTLELTATPFDGLPAVLRKELDVEAERIAAVRDVADVRVVVSD